MKRTPEELLELVQPIVHPYIGNHYWSRKFFKTLIETSRLHSPNKAKETAVAICLREGLHRTTVEHFAKACRYLAILHRYHNTDFEKAIKEA